MRPKSKTLLMTSWILGAVAGFCAAGAAGIWMPVQSDWSACSLADAGPDHPVQKAMQGRASTVDLQEARTQAHRYREGLERAVDELNRLSERCSVRASSPLPTREFGDTPSSKAPARSRLRLKGPKLQIWEEDLVAFGVVINPGDETEVAEVVLELLHNSHVVDEQSLSVFVEAGDETAFEHSFWMGKLEGTYKVRGKLAS